MVIEELLANNLVHIICSFLFGGAIGSFLTIKYNSRKTAIKQEGITVINGDNTGRDKREN